jgi:hypothetical protein
MGPSQRYHSVSGLRKWVLLWLHGRPFWPPGYLDWVHLAFYLMCRGRNTWTYRWPFHPKDRSRADSCGLTGYLMLPSQLPRRYLEAIRGIPTISPRVAKRGTVIARGGTSFNIFSESQATSSLVPLGRQTVLTVGASKFPSPIQRPSFAALNFG